MVSTTKIFDWIRAHRPQLLAAWAAIGAVIVGIMAARPGDYMLRGAPLPKFWAIAFFLSIWAWVALRFIALWIWAWIVMALAPAALYIGMRPYLDAPWLDSLLIGLVIASALVVVAVILWELRRRRLVREQ